METLAKKKENFTSTRNACKLCAPLGASLVFRGLEKCIPLLHGSQGCATYIRRYMISHFKEPIDISSSNFSEQSAIFGGGQNLKQALENVTTQYQPDVIGIASTCLSETIGDDVPAILKSFIADHADRPLPGLVQVSTPSYQGSHRQGYYKAVQAVVRDLTVAGGQKQNVVNVIPGMMSPEDLRYLKSVFQAMEQALILLPDYSETLDGPSWDHYQAIPAGGTPLEKIKIMSASRATVELGLAESKDSAGAFLESVFGVPHYPLEWPVGVKASDVFFKTLEHLTSKPIAPSFLQARGRLLDSYADAHKHTFNVNTVLYGEEDLVVAMAGFVREFGLVPVCCASGEAGATMEARLRKLIPEYDALGIKTMVNADFIEIEEYSRSRQPALMIGNSKGFKTAKALGIPLVRVGFPIHDRIGGQRVLHLGYEGAQQLFDRIVNTLIERKQEASDIGYTYM